MTTALSREELRHLHEIAVDRAQISEPKLFQAIADKLARMIAEASSVRQRGEKVFEWRIPLSIERYATKGKNAGKLLTFVLSPSLNVYSQMEAWQRKRLSSELDVRILAERHKWPDWPHRGRPRAVRVTRYSSAKPDEIAADSIGAKMPVDRLVIAGVLRGDRAEDLEREAHWEKAPPGHGSLLLEIYDLVI
jgi:hypothetical protein